MSADCAFIHWEGAFSLEIARAPHLLGHALSLRMSVALILDWKIATVPRSAGLLAKVLWQNLLVRVFANAETVSQ